MLVERKSWKNLIKPVILSIMEIIANVSLVKIGLFILDYDLGKYKSLVFPIFIALIFVIVKIDTEKVDFEQVVKVEDLSTLSDYELEEYQNNFCNNNRIETKYEEEFFRCGTEMSARKKIMENFN